MACNVTSRSLRGSVSSQARDFGGGRISHRADIGPTIGGLYATSCRSARAGTARPDIALCSDESDATMPYQRGINRLTRKQGCYRRVDRLSCKRVNPMPPYFKHLRGQHYREEAAQLRELASTVDAAEIRERYLRLAALYDRMADQADDEGDDT
jgi:hypothetical protein